jgi:hypothetical protein
MFAPFQKRYPAEAKNPPLLVGYLLWDDSIALD